MARIVDARILFSSLALLAALAMACGHGASARDRLSGDVERVKMIGFTVGDLDRETEFFEKVLQFEKVSDFRIVGSEYDKMQGVFNANMRIVHLKLGEQIVELTSYVSPPNGRPIPVPSYSNDAWFEHVAIVVSDMDSAYKILQDAQCPADFRVSHHDPSVEFRGGRHQGHQVSRSGTSRSGVDLLPSRQG